jgi:hypothetical protein
MRLPNPFLVSVDLKPLTIRRFAPLMTTSLAASSKAIAASFFSTVAMRSPMLLPGASAALPDGSAKLKRARSTTPQAIPRHQRSRCSTIWVRRSSASNRSRMVYPWRRFADTPLAEVVHTVHVLILQRLVRVTAQIGRPLGSQANAPASPSVKGTTYCQHGCAGEGVQGMSLPWEGSLTGQELRPGQKAG